MVLSDFNRQNPIGVPEKSPRRGWEGSFKRQFCAEGGKKKGTLPLLEKRSKRIRGRKKEGMKGGIRMEKERALPPL